MNERAHRHLTAIFRAGLAAADPVKAVRRHVAVSEGELRVARRCYDLDEVRRIFVVGAGKASAAMARALEGILGERIAAGWVNVKAWPGRPLQRVHVHKAGHPLPDEAGVRGAEEILRIAQDAEKGDLIFCCLSGGGSALMPLPVEQVPLRDKRELTARLLACGATIHEMNPVRKHLSRIKGGQLARAAAPAAVVTLALSDVIGDSLGTIASGPTAPDETTFQTALAVLKRYDLEAAIPQTALKYLRAGAAGGRPETPKPGDEVFSSVANVIVANNSSAVEACGHKAEELGYRPLILTTRMEGEAREAAKMNVALAREVLSHGRPVAPPACVISGGETTVTLRGDGLGGRNQEFALAAALAMDGTDGVALLAAGTDGTDGPTDAAGAFADGETCRKAAHARLDAGEYLARNDSYNFFSQLGDLFKTGPTGTNVMDLYLFLVGMT